MAPTYTIGVDLGQSADYTAIAVVESTEEPTGRVEEVAALDARDPYDSWRAITVRRQQTVGAHRVTHLERLPLRTPYTALPAVIGRIEERLRSVWQQARWAENDGRPAYRQHAPIALVIDKTGVGAGVVDYLRLEGLDPVTVSIHGGDQVTEAAYRDLRVPKRDLVGVTSILLQNHRLRIAEGLPDAATLRKELENFRAKISLGGHDTYGAGSDWREGHNDDLVLAVSLACWWAERQLAAANAGAIILQ